MGRSPRWTPPAALSQGNRESSSLQRGLASTTPASLPHRRGAPEAHRPETHNSEVIDRREEERNSKASGKFRFDVPYEPQSWREAHRPQRRERLQGGRNHGGPLQKHVLYHGGGAQDESFAGVMQASAEREPPPSSSTLSGSGVGERVVPRLDIGATSTANEGSSRGAYTDEQKPPRVFRDVWKPPLGKSRISRGEIHQPWQVWLPDARSAEEPGRRGTAVNRFRKPEKHKAPPKSWSGSEISPSESSQESRSGFSHSSSSGRSGSVRSQSENLGRSHSSASSSSTSSISSPSNSSSREELTPPRPYSKRSRTHGGRGESSRRKERNEMRSHRADAARRRERSDSGLESSKKHGKRSSESLSSWPDSVGRKVNGVQDSREVAAIENNEERAPRHDRGPSAESNGEWYMDSHGIWHGPGRELASPPPGPSAEIVGRPSVLAMVRDLNTKKSFLSPCLENNDAITKQGAAVAEVLPDLPEVDHNSPVKLTRPGGQPADPLNDGPRPSVYALCDAWEKTGIFGPPPGDKSSRDTLSKHQSGEKTASVRLEKHSTRRSSSAKEKILGRDSMPQSQIRDSQSSSQIEAVPDGTTLKDQSIAACGARPHACGDGKIKKPKSALDKAVAAGAWDEAESLVASGMTTLHCSSLALLVEASPALGAKIIRSSQGSPFEPTASAPGSSPNRSSPDRSSLDRSSRFRFSLVCADAEETAGPTSVRPYEDLSPPLGEQASPTLRTSQIRWIEQVDGRSLGVPECDKRIQERSGLQDSVTQSPTMENLPHAKTPVARVKPDPDWAQSPPCTAAQDTDLETAREQIMERLRALSAAVEDGAPWDGWQDPRYSEVEDVAASAQRAQLALRELADAAGEQCDGRQTAVLEVEASVFSAVSSLMRLARTVHTDLDPLSPMTSPAPSPQRREMSLADLALDAEEVAAEHWPGMSSHASSRRSTVDYSVAGDVPWCGSLISASQPPALVPPGFSPLVHRELPQWPPDLFQTPIPKSPRAYAPSADRTRANAAAWRPPDIVPPRALWGSKEEPVPHSWLRMNSAPPSAPPSARMTPAERASAWLLHKHAIAMSPSVIEQQVDIEWSPFDAG